jgi:hypothetical protein
VEPLAWSPRILQVKPLAWSPQVPGGDGTHIWNYGATKHSIPIIHKNWKNVSSNGSWVTLGLIIYFVIADIVMLRGLG